VLVSDGVTEALDGLPLEDDLSLQGGVTAAGVCDSLLTKALAGHGPDPDWDDDRTVVVMIVEAMGDGTHPVPRAKGVAHAA
jgi:hypothetical protein